MIPHWLKVLAVLLEERSLIPGPHIKGLTIAYNSNPRVFGTLFWHLIYIYLTLCVHIYIEIHVNACN